MPSGQLHEMPIAVRRLCLALDACLVGASLWTWKSTSASQLTVSCLMRSHLASVCAMEKMERIDPIRLHPDALQIFVSHHDLPYKSPIDPCKSFINP